MTADLERAITSMMVEARRQVDRSACSECDPGGEGSEVWGELVNEMDAALKIEKLADRGQR